MAYGDSLGITLPTVGAANGGGLAIAAMINSAFNAIIARLETKVTTAGLDLNADVSLKSGAVYSGLKDVHRVSLYNNAAALSAVTYPQAVYAVGSDLYFNDAAGNQVRIVTAGEVDVSSVGGITGAGYGSSGVELTWNGTEYVFKSGTGADALSAVKMNDVMLHDGSGNYVRLGAATMGADYNLTLPAAVPTSIAQVLVSAAGQVSFGTGFGTAVVPAQITADQNNYTPGAGSVFLLSTDAARNITGFATSPSQDAGISRSIVIANTGSFNIVLVHQSGSSTAGNRFILPGAANLTITPGESKLLFYDDSALRWRATV